jgi:hypothetical protein
MNPITLDTRLSARLILDPPAPESRLGEPVRCGLPWPRGAVRDVGDLRMIGPDGTAVPLQARVRDRWSDGSARWVLLDWKADTGLPGGFDVGPAPSIPEPSTGLLTAGVEGRSIRVSTGRARFRLGPGRGSPFEAIAIEGRSGPGPQFRLAAEDASGHSLEMIVDRVALDEIGPVRAVVRFDGRIADGRGRELASLSGDLHFIAESATVSARITITNPERAGHPENCWDLGDEGSFFLRDFRLEIGPASTEGPISVSCSPERGAICGAVGPDLELYQDSSGGENWKSHNHLNRKGRVPLAFRGYRLRSGGEERYGLRASPVVVLDHPGGRLAVTMRYFWENFPKAIEAGPDGIILRLLPGQFGDLHELQGGERKSHDLVVAFDGDDVTETPLDWCRSPLLPRAEPTWYADSGAVPFLTPSADDPHEVYLGLVNAAIEGEDTFSRKREVIDEYGWRHFGDLYGDHEAVLHQGPEPLTSHYNNQYDVIHGLAMQFLRSGDPRWHAQMDEMAMHVADIDIYHTDRDKSAYNGGLFWHTVHYIDAGTSTHRSYPRANRSGGGPSGGQLYAWGLLLHYFLTGDRLSREAVVGLGRYVIDADDGSKTVFRLLSRGPTGHPTASGDPSYHGPGRAPANSVMTLLAAHAATGDSTFLDQAERIICRAIHPADNVDGRDLLDAERRWFYTMFLQALGRYLDHKADLGQLDRMYAYARGSLLHYARWMAEHEFPYLDRPERLEYPNETWAAQDMRKSEVFKHAARHTSGAERARFLERSEFFFASSTTSLAAMPTRTLARPVVLLLTNGYMHDFFRRHPGTSAPEPKESASGGFGLPETFVPQKARAKRNLAILAAGAMIGIVVVLIRLVF